MKKLVNKKYLLEKFPGKGGWTYARIPEIVQNKHIPFGWVKVKGMIDDYEIRQYKLMPMGNDSLFLPVNARIRKVIGKEAGDYIMVTLYRDNGPVSIPQELLVCLQDEPLAYRNFFQLTEGQQKAYIDWIYAPKKESTRIDRIAFAITQISKGLTLTKTKTEPSGLLSPQAKTSFK